MQATVERKDVYQILTERVCEMLKKGIVPWRKPWAGGSLWPMNGVSKKHYRGFNVFMLNAVAQEAGYKSPYWLSYKQAGQLGGQVRKGEKATIVVYWNVSMVADKSPEAKPDAKKKLFLLRYYNVFNVDQCDWPEGSKRPVDPEDSTRLDKKADLQKEIAKNCREVVKGWASACPIRHTGNRCAYAPILDSISMPQVEAFESNAAYYASLFHEMIHATGHTSRLDRGLSTTFDSEPYAKEELVAEMGSAMLCYHCGFSSTLENSAAYLANWLQKLQSDPKLLVQAAGAAQKAVDHILGVTFGDESDNHSK